MKKMILSTVLLASSIGFAAPPAPAPEPSLEGTWNVTSRACTSNAAINDGVKIGQDKLSVTQNADKTFEYKMNVGGCETTVKGTYAVDGMKVTYTALTTQGCKDNAPKPMSETFSSYVAYLSATEAVIVTTGDKAAMVCPAGDALVVHYAKEGATPTP
jgi:hypothetical protein